MAANSSGVTDEDGDRPDWIEIHNTGATPVNLGNWCLTDSPGNLSKWRFPEATLGPNAFLVVFASEKDRRLPGAALHTNFKLNADGEFLALVQPDGATIASSFAPSFPAQVPDVSYGLGVLVQETVLVETGATARVQIPRDGALGLDWTQVEFNDATWTNGLTGVGYQTAVMGGIDMRPFILTDVRSRMFNSNASAFIRIGFQVTDTAQIDHLTLSLRYDDGFVAYLNGVEVASDRAPDPLAWNSTAVSDRVDAEAGEWAEISLDGERGLLRPGPNLLAIQGLNSLRNNANFLISPRLVAGHETTPTNVLRYFSRPTPGSDNGAGAASVGPLVTDFVHHPALPQDEDDIVVTARLTPAFAAVESATLRYRVMFSNEVSLPFLDDGQHGDGAAGDGLYGAVVPAQAAQAGEMVRWYVLATDTAGRNSRWPSFEDPRNSPEYEGTMISVTVTSSLPVLHWFVQSPAAADTDTGTRSTLYYDGELYDNLLTRIRGQATRGYPKKSYKFDFHRGRHFRYDRDRDRVEEMNLLTTSSDKSFTRLLMAYESFRDAGLASMHVFPMRVQRNNAFYSVHIFLEHPDETWMERVGLDPNGSFYKMFNSLEGVGGAVKRTRRHEGTEDLGALTAALSASNTNRVAYLFDNVDLAAMANYMAVMIVLHDNDAPHKNYWMYRDTEGTREWSMLPWDKDLSFGVNWDGGLSDTLWATNDMPPGSVISPSHPFFADRFHQKVDSQWNRLIDALHSTPRTREMFLRRLRSVMDQLLQPPGSFPGELHYEQRMDELFSLMAPDVALDLPRWPPAYGARMEFATGMKVLQESYLARRRVHLYLTHSLHNPGYAKCAFIPDAQPADCSVQFGAVEVNPVSGRQAEEYVQLRNTNAFAIDLTGWSVRGGIEHSFTPGTVMSSNSVMYLSPDVVSFRARTLSPRGGETNHAQGNYRGQLSARGETLELVNARGAVVTTLAFPGQPSLAQQFLRVTELMYHPAPATGSTVTEDFEFIELMNAGPTALDLTGVRFVNGIRFDFAGSMVLTLAPGARVVVVKNLAAFQQRYGTGLPVAGSYTGSLANSGERIQLLDAGGEEILDFTFDNAWHAVTDGAGFALVTVEPSPAFDQLSLPTSWRPGSRVQGTPGLPEAAFVDVVPVLINEVRPRSGASATAAIELHNPGIAPADISHWWLTDDFDAPRKFRFAAETVIPPGAFLVVLETQLDPPGAGAGGVLFTDTGGEAHLFSASADGTFTGWHHGFEFGPGEEAGSVGRHVTSLGEEHRVAQASVSLGQPNAAPKVGPLVISEIFYHPPDQPRAMDNSDEEYIEVQNITTVDTCLCDAAAPGAPWQLRGGVEFDLPTDLVLPAGGRVLLVSFDPATNAAHTLAFVNRYAVPTGTPLLGPYQGKLDNSADTVELLKPRRFSNGRIESVRVDRVRYSETAPWPPLADGLGLALQRRVLSGYGDDPANWVAAAPSAGASWESGPAPVFVSEPLDLTRFVLEEAQFTVSAQGSPPLWHQWRFNGVPLPGAHGATLSVLDLLPSHAGAYDAVVFNSAGAVTSRTAVLTVRLVPRIQEQPRDAILAVGTNYSFWVRATGSSSLSYQWEKDGQELPGATTDTLALSNLQEAQSGSYRVRITDDVGTAFSRAATLQVLVRPTVVQQLENQSVLVGDSARFSVVAGGTLPLTFRWRRNGVGVYTNTINSHTSVLTLASAQLTNAGTYSVLISNAATFIVISANANLIVWADADGDRMADTWELANGLATNNAADRLLDADGDGHNNLQEYVTGTDPRNAQSRLRLDRVDPQVTTGRTTLRFQAVSNRTYTVEFREAPGTGRWTPVAEVGVKANNRTEIIVDPFPISATRVYRVSVPARLEARTPGPVLLQSPQAARGSVGQELGFHVFAHGSGPLRYQWHHNGLALVGATASNLVVSSAGLADMGQYHVEVADNAGTTASDPVPLGLAPTIAQQPVGQTVPAGGTISLTVDATGLAPLSYWWFKERRFLPGQTNAELVIPNAAVDDSGGYHVLVRQQTPAGLLGTFSSNVIITVTPP